MTKEDDFLILALYGIDVLTESFSSQKRVLTFQKCFFNSQFSYSLDSNQAQSFNKPNLDPNYLQRQVTLEKNILTCIEQTSVLTLHSGNSSCFCCRLLTFANQLFSKFFQEHYVSFQIRTNVLLFMISVQTVISR